MTRRWPLVSVACTAVVVLLGLIALAQEAPSTGDSGPAVGDFQVTDGTCNFPNFTDDSYTATLGEDEQGRYIEFTQQSTGDSGRFRISDLGEIIFETQGDEAYSEIQFEPTADNDVLRAVYTYQTGDCLQTWQATVSLPPGYVTFLQSDPRFVTTTLASTTTVQPTAESVAPAVVLEDETGATTTAPTELPNPGGEDGGIPIFVWLLIAVILLIIAYLIWRFFFATETGGPRSPEIVPGHIEDEDDTTQERPRTPVGSHAKGPGDDEDGDSPGDTPPPVIYGEEIEADACDWYVVVHSDQGSKPLRMPRNGKPCCGIEITIESAVDFESEDLAEQTQWRVNAGTVAPTFAPDSMLWFMRAQQLQSSYHRGIGAFARAKAACTSQEVSDEQWSGADANRWPATDMSTVRHEEETLRAVTHSFPNFSTAAAARYEDSTGIRLIVHKNCPPGKGPQDQDQRTRLVGQGFLAVRSESTCTHGEGEACQNSSNAQTGADAHGSGGSNPEMRYSILPNLPGHSGVEATAASEEWTVEFDGSEVDLGPFKGKVSGTEVSLSLGPVAMKGTKRTVVAVDHNKKDKHPLDRPLTSRKENGFDYDYNVDVTVHNVLSASAMSSLMEKGDLTAEAEAEAFHELTIDSRPNGDCKHPDDQCDNDECASVSCLCDPYVNITFPKPPKVGDFPHCIITTDDQEMHLARRLGGGPWSLG